MILLEIIEAIWFWLIDIGSRLWWAIVESRSGFIGLTIGVAVSRLIWVATWLAVGWWALASSGRGMNGVNGTS